MDLSVTIGKNIRSLMESRSVTAVDLAKTLSISRQTLLNYLKGASAIDTVKLVEIADYFGVSIDTLLQTDNTSNNYLFRTALNYQLAQSSIAPRINQCINSYYNLAKAINIPVAYFPEQYNLLISNNNSTIDINFDCNDYFSKKLELNSELKEEIKKIALDQRKKLGLFDADALTAISVLQKKGINIFFVDFGNCDSFGVSYVDDEKGCYIFVNTNSDITFERILFTVFHEYGHIILHRPLYRRKFSNDTPGTYSFLDRMANCFAGFFLVPEDSLTSYDNILNNITSIGSLIPIKQKFQISLQSLIMVLGDYNYVSQQFVHSFFEYLKQHDMMKDEPDSIIDFPKISNSFDTIKNEKTIDILRFVYSNTALDIDTIKSILWIDENKAANLLAQFNAFQQFSNADLFNNFFKNN
ncbi:MAG: helix-turn-helix domain protein [Clostridia bacterium]|jgi:Zn-dependent peptidase ImmA (M78 family)|nr:helix-turn-helix domain protein [Clostridia bacterium]